MSAGEIVAIALAGMAAGTINTVVGSGTLITFPVLLAFGYAPVTANISNTIGLVPGSVSGAIGYRRELSGQRGRALRLGVASLLGGITGAVLLLVLPASTFKAIVPAFIAIALVLALAQPALNRRLAHHVAGGARRVSVLLPVAVYVTGVYGGYFGAGQGIILLAILGVALPQSLHDSNALKNVLAGLVNGVAGVYFVFAANVRWGPAAIIAGSSILGAQLGARYGRRLPPDALRALIVLVGVAAIVRLLTE
ncbi:MAG TPA: sulfite exporter TauE/SafE family protein [Solirubrobacteraceae bacterium]|nr:sulfite exporter TauE/SafE family protein [Solirubrobacteraceae bacterium]